MIPVLAIVGRPNVGKSTLFNRITKRRDALVADMPGVTRDRQYGEGHFEGAPFLVIDTGGITDSLEEGIEAPMASQAKQAILEADVLLFVVDPREGVMPADESIARFLRRTGKPVYLVVNKIDGLDPDVAMAEFHRFGFTDVLAISATHGRGMKTLLTAALSQLKPAASPADEAEHQGIKIAIVGRPNVGKSTLVNRLLGEERVIVYDQPGTTRDSIYIDLADRGQRYTLIDTAGVRRRGRIHDVVEKFSVIKTLQAIQDAHVVIFVCNAQERLVDQDASLLGFVLDAGKSLVVAVNKWDGLSNEQRTLIKKDLDRRLGFVSFAKTHLISALHGTDVGNLLPSVKAAYESAMQPMPTAKLTRILLEGINAHPPPLVRGRRIKLRYAHAGGHNPPHVVIHGNQTVAVPLTYQRYLSNLFRDKLRLVGTPIRISFKTGENPYEHKKNILTPTQLRKRKRLIRHVKRRGRRK